MPKRTPKGTRKPPVPGIFFHRASGQFIAYIGYHIKTATHPKTGAEIDRRVRTTHYLGTDQTAALSKFYAVKAGWQRVITS